MVNSVSTVIKQKELKDFYKVKLKNGKEIICSLDHKLFVQRNKRIIELKLSDIKTGDKICIKGKSN
jgi:intein/homing endonuclease